MMYPFVTFGQFHALVSIYARDGTVSVTHGGIECGQGINTKVLANIIIKSFYIIKKKIFFHYR